MAVRYTLAWVKFVLACSAWYRWCRQASVNGPPSARFPGSALTRADFSRATLEGRPAWRGAENITAGFESLRGAIMTTAQFLALAR